MAININARTDVSYLFSSLGSGAASVAGSTFLSDYMSIKNGSYAKLMKAYYGGNASSAVKSAVNNSTRRSTAKSELTSEESKAYSKVKSASDALKDSADALLATGKKSVFAKKDVTTKDENGVETTTQEYDKDAIYSAVNKFVNDYNSVIKAVDDADNDDVASRASRMVNDSISNLKSLLKAGISINADSTLSLDKDAFMEADMGTVKNLFNGNGSYGYRVSAQASLINYAADRASENRSFYNTNGSYSASYNNGNLFNSYF